MKTKTASLTALVLAAALIPAAANASSLETFTFTQTGYPVDDRLTGTFTGVVEPDGSIQQADLTAFTASFFYDEGAFGVEVDTYSLANLQLFHSFRRRIGPTVRWTFSPAPQAERPPASASAPQPYSDFASRVAIWLASSM